MSKQQKSKGAKKAAPATTTETAPKTTGEAKPLDAAPAKATRFLAMHKHPATTPETKGAAKVKGTKGETKPAPKPAKVKPEAKAREELLVFALRMSESERTRLHEACGPAKATRFARAVLIAFSNGDDVIFRKLVKEAEEGKAKAEKK